MICLPCRDDEHIDCPDFTSDYGSNFCDCQHKERGSAIVVNPAA